MSLSDPLNQVFAIMILEIILAVAILTIALSKAHARISSIAYISFSGALMILIAIIQYYRHDMFGTGLVLGWDSPFYVWSANEVITIGSLHMMQHWNFPQLYTQLLAFLSYLPGDVTMMERILPLLFGIVVIYANYRLAYGISDNPHIAGATALLTIISLNFFRLLADLHRNLMAFSLSLIVLLLIPSINEKTLPKNKNYVFFMLLLFIIASTHLETFVVLSISILLYGIMRRNLRETFQLALTCAIPGIVLLLLFPALPKYPGVPMESLTHRWLTPEEVMPYIGGSLIPLSMLFIGTGYLVYKALRCNNRLASLLLSWVFVIVSLTLSNLIGLPLEFSWRALLLLPVPILVTLGLGLLGNILKTIRVEMHLKHFSSERIFKITLYRPMWVILILLLTFGSVFPFLEHFDKFLTPYISRSGYDKILMAKQFLMTNNLSVPVVVFYGSPGVWIADVYRGYIGAHLGEHFAYYGHIENLLRLSLTDFQWELEKEKSIRYYNELTGNMSYGATSWTHTCYIRDIQSLATHPTVIITPELYNGDPLPYFVRPFHIGEGVYVIPPNYVSESSGVFYGPTITVIRNGITTHIKSEYLYSDPHDPSIVYIRVNGSRGFESYNFTDLPANWIFVKLEQGGDISSPEKNPKRLNGSIALSGNDPADAPIYWSVWQYGNFSIDPSFRKEGLGSLNVMGKTNEWDTLFARYDPPGTWDLSSYSVLSMWARSNETATFAINLHDINSKRRTYWDAKVGEESITTHWKRFVVNLNNYTYQDDGFNLSSVDCIALYVFLKPWANVSFSIDDLTVDQVPDINIGVYKTRVMLNETVIAYFSVKERQG